MRRITHIFFSVALAFALLAAFSTVLPAQTADKGVRTTGSTITDNLVKWDSSGRAVDAGVAAVGGTASTRGVYASRPTCNSGANGSLYFLTDGMTHFQCNGTSWQGYFGSFPITETSAAAGWTALGTATTFADNKGGLLFTIPASSQLVGRLKAVPAAPFTKAFALTELNPGHNGSGCGIAITNGTTAGASGSQIKIFAHFAGHGLAVFQLNDTTGYTATDFGETASDSATGAGATATLRFLRYRDDNTDRFWEASPNGQDWIVIGQQGRTTTFTATHYGIACFGNGSNNSVIGALYVSEF